MILPCLIQAANHRMPISILLILIGSISDGSIYAIDARLTRINTGFHRRRIVVNYNPIYTASAMTPILLIFLARAGRLSISFLPFPPIGRRIYFSCLRVITGAAFLAEHNHTSRRAYIYARFAAFPPCWRTDQFCLAAIFFANITLIFSIARWFFSHAIYSAHQFCVLFGRAAWGIIVLECQMAAVAIAQYRFTPFRRFAHRFDSQTSNLSSTFIHCQIKA